MNAVTKLAIDGLAESGGGEIVIDAGQLYRGWCREHWPNRPLEWEPSALVGVPR